MTSNPERLTPEQEDFIRDMLLDNKASTNIDTNYSNVSREAAATLCGPGKENCPPDSMWLANHYYNRITVFVDSDGESADYAYGAWQSRLKWKPDTVYGVPINTLSFKGNWLEKCDNVWSGASRPCRPSQTDAIFVDRASYEVEGHVPNPNCYFYTGNPSIDRFRGCFSAYYALSNLPYWYLDTTFSDFGTGVYQAAIGSGVANRIREGAEYYAHIGFDAYRQNRDSLVGQQTRYFGEIGQRVGSCSRGLKWCTYRVDTSIRGRGILLPIPVLP